MKCCVLTLVSRSVLLTLVFSSAPGSHLKNGAGVCVGETGGSAGPQNEVPARQAFTVGPGSFPAPLLVCRLSQAKQALMVEPIRSFEGQKKG